MMSVGRVSGDKNTTLFLDSFVMKKAMIHSCVTNRAVLQVRDKDNVTNIKTVIESLTHQCHVQEKVTFHH